MRGRGLLGKWGPNFAADPIVTRFSPKEQGVLQIVAIKRADTGEWALPGGMVDPGESVSVAVRREFTEEAGNIPSEEGRAIFKKHAENLFKSGEVAYTGYVDDPRNTDCAWMETTAYHFHCNAELGALLPLHAGDDAKDVMWINAGSEEHAALYASHKDWVDGIIFKMATSARRGSEAGRSNRAHVRVSSVGSAASSAFQKFGTGFKKGIGRGE